MIKTNLQVMTIINMCNNNKNSSKYIIYIHKFRERLGKYMIFCQKKMRLRTLILVLFN